MLYVRVSLTTPKAGSREDVLRLEDELIEFFRQQPGFLEAYRLRSNDRVGRVTVWDSQASADHAASTQHTLALRSQLLPLVTDSVEAGLDGERVV